MTNSFFIKTLKLSILKFVIILVGMGAATAYGQTTSTPPTLYDQNGAVVNGFNDSARSLNAGWYYSSSGSPLYYYANGVYYDPSTQSYGGEVIYPDADGPSTITPGVPNTGAGGTALTVVLALLVSASGAVAGTYFLSKSKLI